MCEIQKKTRRLTHEHESTGKPEWITIFPEVISKKNQDDHDAWTLRPADKRREHSETSQERATADADDERGHARRVKRFEEVSSSSTFSSSSCSSPARAAHVPWLLKLAAASPKVVAVVVVLTAV